LRERESEERRQQPLIAIDKKEKFKCLVDNFYNHYRCLSFIRTRNTHFCIFIINICLEFLCFAYSKFFEPASLVLSNQCYFFRISVNINCDVDWVEITPLTWFTLKFNRKNLISFQKLEIFHSFLYITPQKKMKFPSQANQFFIALHYIDVDINLDFTIYDIHEFFYFCSSYEHIYEPTTAMSVI